MSHQPKHMLMHRRATLLACLATTAVAAQPVVTAADAPAPGFAWTVLELANLPPLAAGANATWNLSGATITGTRQLQLAQPSSAPGASNFPNATVVANADGGPPYNFLQASSSELRTLGVMSTAPNIYTDPLITMVFPCSLGTSWTDTYSNAAEQGTRSYVADGYGTLIGPNGTLTNLLRVHSEYNTLDTVVDGILYQAVMVEDAFWRSGTRWPVATSFWFRTFADGIIVQEQRVGSMLEIVSSLSENGILCNIARAWPNPARDNIQVELGVDGWHEVSWLDASGRTIAAENCFLNPGAPTMLPLPSAARGVFWLRLVTHSGRSVFLPIVIE